MRRLLIALLLLASSARANIWSVTNDILSLTQIATNAVTGEMRLTVYARSGTDAINLSGIASSRWAFVDTRDSKEVYSSTGIVVTATNGHIRFEAPAFTRTGTFTARGRIFPTGSDPYDVSWHELTVTSVSPVQVTVIGSTNSGGGTLSGAYSTNSPLTAIVSGTNVIVGSSSPLATGTPIYVESEWRAASNTISTAITQTSNAIPLLAQGTGITFRVTTNGSVATYTIDSQYSPPSIVPGTTSYITTTNSVTYSALTASTTYWQNCVIPVNVTQALIHCFGGGASGANGLSGGGDGGYAFYQLAVVGGQQLFVGVGQGGRYSSSTNAALGGGYVGNLTSNGGGATIVALRTNGFSWAATATNFITNVVCAAGGGGAMGYNSALNRGGSGGGVSGASGSGTTPGAGGTQSAGGTTNGAFFYGGQGSGTAGGGGCPYGGGAGSAAGTAGGGGSGYVMDTTRGFTANSYNPGSPAWSSGIGVGGFSQANGGDGKVVIYYQSP